MDFENFIQYMKTMIPSVLLMLLVAFGMATENTWIQYGSILIILAAQLGYQTIKSVRSAPLLDANMKEAEKAKRGRLLLKANENDIKEIKKEVGDSGDMGFSSKTLLIMFVPLVIFFASSYILGIVSPEMPRWQSYLIGFILSLPASLVLTAKAGVNPSRGISFSPNTYYINERGIAFDYLGRPFILIFPIKNLNVKKEKKYIEVEGQPTKTLMIPNKLKLFNQDVDQLQRILTRFTETKT